MDEVRCFGFGAPETPGDYPIIRAMGWAVDPADSLRKFGCWESRDAGSSWAYVFQFIDFNYAGPSDIAGDRSIYGRWALTTVSTGVYLTEHETTLMLM